MHKLKVNKEYRVSKVLGKFLSINIRHMHMKVIIMLLGNKGTHVTLASIYPLKLF
jgi:hypothetical protein